MSKQEEIRQRNINLVKKTVSVMRGILDESETALDDEDLMKAHYGFGAISDVSSGLVIALEGMMNIDLHEGILDIQEGEGDE